MTPIIEMRFGSHLYGTATAQSDIDLKGVYLPSARDILLQQVQPSVTFSGGGKQPGERNKPGDVDRDFYSLQRYLDLLIHGQTVALDMLFAPDAAFTQVPHACWLEIRANRDRLVSRRASAFVHYCQQQAHKFGVKGSRIAAARQVLAVLIDGESRFGTTAKLQEVAPTLATLVEASAHLDWIELPSPAGPDGAMKPIRNLVVCGRKIPLTMAIKLGREIVQRLVDDYGARALAAEQNEGVDWKALSHAVRVGREALELFRDRHIVFPLACADHLRAIKAGQVPYEAVAAEIETLLVEVEAAAVTSQLPAEPDLAFVEDLVKRYYRAQITVEIG